MNNKGHGPLCKRTNYIESRLWLYKLGFIHITKTGGTNLKDKNIGDFFYGIYHHEDGLFYKSINMPCFAILRDPIERYKSLFYYNNYGSNKYKHVEKHSCNNINEFVFMHFKRGWKFVKCYEKGMQFRKQIEWLNGDAEQIYIVLFDKNKLMHNINAMCNSLGIGFEIKDCSNYINATNYTNRGELTSSSIDIIKEMYKKDVELYNSLVSKNVPFCKLSELI
jgi:hypothetical protein